MRNKLWIVVLVALVAAFTLVAGGTALAIAMARIRNRVMGPRGGGGSIPADDTAVAFIRLTRTA